MVESKKKCRQYSIDYLKFGFIPSSDNHLPMCLLCNKVLCDDAMKPSKLEDHLRRCHPDKTVDSMFTLTSKRDNVGLRVSYKISLLIAKSGKSHTIGDQLILPAIEEVLKTILHKPAYDVLKRIPLSHNTVQRRIDEMSYDVESFLYNYLQTTHFPIQLYESTLPGNEALLLAYVSFVMDQETHKELLFPRTLTTDTKGKSIFNVLRDYFMEKAIPLSNIISAAADGAPAMFGRYQRNCQDDDASAYVQHLNVLHTDFETRFEDVLTVEIQQWIINPYSDIEETDVILQEKLTRISTNEELKVQFRKKYQQFWLQRDLPVSYPALWTIARKFLIAFPSSYLMERGFSTFAN
ncbi:hypothetical protein PR048_001160 [Dryococelus australis]|uniref:SCAN domain-containing protein 3 n=1 Tax=Dryococelus australis TaxID=614101 RepID=A0ABQ9IH82_9NEOP|nr:hypothetical protein PR048_001160 [Dryococelus australis]